MSTVSLHECTVEDTKHLHLCSVEVLIKLDFVDGYWHNLAVDWF